MSCNKKKLCPPFAHFIWKLTIRWRVQPVMIPEENEDTVSYFLENHHIPNHIKNSNILHSKSTSTLVAIKCKQNNSTDICLVLWPKHQYNWIVQEVTKMHMWIFCVYIYIIIPLYQGRCSGFTTIDTIITFDCCMNVLSSHDGLMVYSTIASDYTIIKDVMPGLNNKTETATQNRTSVVKRGNKRFLYLVLKVSRTFLFILHLVWRIGREVNGKL